MHMQRKWRSGVLFSLLFTLVLAACSSGGGDSDSAAPVVPAGTAEGLWTGTMAGRTLNGAVLDDGTYWFLYSEVGAPTIMAGTLQGNGSTSNGTFASSNGLDFFNGSPPLPPEKLDVTVTGSYVMQQNLGGTVTYSAGALTFTSTFNSENSVAPVIANVADTYSGSAFGFPHTITISNLGVVTVTTTGGPHRTGASADASGIELGCDFTGTLTPRSQGGNMYDIVLTPDPSNILTFAQCNPATLTGVAFFDATDNKRIYVLALNSSRNRVFPFTGTRP